MKSKNSQALALVTRGALIAALYVLLTLLSSLVGLSSGVIQCRLSEMLCALPFFLPEATVGLWIGCMLANFLTGSALYDCIFGSLATLVGAVITLLLGKVFSHSRSKVPFFLAGVPAVLVNALVIPVILRLVYGIEDGYWFLAATVGAGEILPAVILGGFLLIALEKRKVLKSGAKTD